MLSRPRARHAKLFLQRLEDRCTPATITLIGSTLTVSNPKLVGLSSQLDITQTGTSSFQVKENTISVGTYSNVSTIVVNGSNGDDTINVTIGSMKSLSGSLSVNGNNGNDTITVNGNGSGEIRGNVSLDGGNGTDTVQVANTSGVTVRGSTNLSAGLGTDTAQVAFGGASTFKGNLGFYGFNTFNYSIANTTLSAGLTFSMRLNSASGTYKPVSTFAGTGGIIIPGTLAVDFSGNNDSITVNATSVGALAISMGGGTDTVTISSDVARNTAINFGTGNGTITVNAGVDFNTSATAGSGLSIAMGDGVNTYNLNTAFTVKGNLSITAAANGLNNQIFTLAGTVTPTSGTLGTSADGNVTITTGYGDDDVTINTVILGNLNQAGAGNLTVNVGQGANTFTVNAASTYSNLTFAAGDGGNTVTIAVPNPVGTHNLTLTFGGGGANNVTLSGGTMGGGKVTVNWTDGIADDTLNWVLPDPPGPSPLGAGYSLVETGVR